jgi:hypothetical protein
MFNWLTFGTNSGVFLLAIWIEFSN